MNSSGIFGSPVLAGMIALQPYHGPLILKHQGFCLYQGYVIQLYTRYQAALASCEA